MSELSDRALILAVELYFGGRDRAEHIVTCDACGHDEAGEFKACPRCPRPTPVSRRRP